MKHPTFRFFTKDIWTSCSKDLVNTINIYQNNLVSWNKNTFGNIFSQVKRTKARLYGVKKTLDYKTDSQLLLLEKNLQMQLKQLLETEENIWMMKSRINWISSGDRNNSFLHLSALNRCRKNKITQLLGPDQIWITDPLQIERALISHLKKTFALDLDNTQNDQLTLSNINFPFINYENTYNLIEIPSEGEIC